jgi:hypothetical protein
VRVFDTGHHTAELFAGLWALRQLPWFSQYIEAAFGVRVIDLPELKGIVVTEAESGNVTNGMVQSLGIRAWVADDRGFRAVTEADVPPWARDSNAAGDAGRMYSGWAEFHFFADGDRVAIRGTLGPALHCRMTGRVAVAGGELVFADVRVPEPPGVYAVNPLSPVCAALELRVAKTGRTRAAPDPAI